MAEAKYIPRLKAEYQDKIVKVLEKELKIDNVNNVPKLDKVIVSCGVGKKRDDKRFTETVENLDVTWKSGNIRIEYNNSN